MDEDPDMTSNSTVYSISGVQAATMVMKEFNRSYMPVIIAVGLTGNLVSVIIFQATDLRRTPSSHYLTALAISDSGVLLGNLVMRFKFWVTKPWFCKILFYIQYVSLFLSVWMVVAFTFERLIAVCFPLKLFKICTVRRALCIIAGLMFTAAVLNSYVFFIVTAAKTFDDQSLCLPKFGGVYDLVYLVFNYIDTAATMIIPMISIVVLNLIIAAKVTNKGKKLISVSGGENEMHSCSSVHGPIHREQKITKMLLIVSIVFIIMNMPDHIARIIGTWIQSDTLTLVSTITNAWFNTGFAINFFLYSAVGVRFRYYLKSGISYAVWRCSGGKIFLNASKVEHRISGSSDVKKMTHNQFRRLTVGMIDRRSSSKTYGNSRYNSKTIATRTKSDILLNPSCSLTKDEEGRPFLATETHC